MMKRGKHLRYPSLGSFFENGKTLILAYDQGFEHGPIDFNAENANPEYVFDIALEGGLSALAVQAGIAEKFHVTHYKDVNLIVKLNAKTSFLEGDPVSLQHTTVSYAIEMGAKAVGYTIYLGSEHEQEMFKEFGKIVEEAHSAGIPVICWMYPRGKAIKDELATNTLAYAARVAAELGADIVKLKSPENVDKGAVEWIVRCAGRTKVVFAGGSKIDNLKFLKHVEMLIRAGASGMAIGRNIWQDKNPKELVKALKAVVFQNKGAEEAFSMMKK